MPNNLLPNWSWVKLGDVAEFKNGINFGKNQKGETGVLTIDVYNMYSNSIYVDLQNLYRVDKEIREDHKLKYGDLLFVRSSVKREGVGFTTAFRSFNEDVTYCGFIIRARLSSEKLLPEFATYFFRSSTQRNKIVSKAKQVTITNISQDGLSALTIPLPSLPEQKKIVEKIEELFSGLDSGVASLKKAKEQLRLYRQSVLASAFSGKLTQEVRCEKREVITKAAEPNVEYKNNGLPEDWKWVKLGEVCEDVKMIQKNTKDLEDEFFYFDIGGINNNTNTIESFKKYQWKNAPSRARQIVEKGDILFSTVRTYLKNIALLKYDYDEKIASTGFCIIRPDRKQLISEYIFYYSLGTSFLEPLNKLQTGSSYPAVRDNDVFSQIIPLAPLTQQTQIVEEIEKRFSEADNLEKAIDDSLEKSEALRQSILKQAFEGKLV